MTGDAVLQKTPFSFDVSVWEFYLPLLVGARLVVARPEGHERPGICGAAIQREQVTTVHARRHRCCRSLWRQEEGSAGA